MLNPDIKITIRKTDKCFNGYCWSLYRSDRNDPILGGLTEIQAKKHKKIMLNLIKSVNPYLENNQVASSTG